MNGAMDALTIILSMLADASLQARVFFANRKWKKILFKLLIGVSFPGCQEWSLWRLTHKEKRIQIQSLLAEQNK